VDPRFLTLDDEQKNEYILCVIVPEAMVLITQNFFLDEGVNELQARSLAIEYLNKPDIVSLISDLRDKSR
jgi:hypothetical protein